MISGFASKGQLLNRLCWRGMRGIMNLTTGRRMNKSWRKCNLPPTQDALTEAMCSDSLNLIGVSSVFAEQLPDWHEKHKVCGFFELPETSEAWTMPDELKSFLDDGPPPVYMFFGTLQQVDGDDIVPLMVQAAKKANCRAIIQTLEDSSYSNRRDGDIYYITRVPHRYIFPRCAAVVHHGGAGTTHSVTQAGCPSIVVEYFGDQEIWGRAIRQLKAGAFLHRRRLTANKLAAAITKVLNTPEIKQKAERLAQQMQQEEGVTTAIKHIEQLEVGKILR